MSPWKKLRAKLPAPEDDDDFYHADLLGLEARLDTGVVIGTRCSRSAVQHVSTAV